MTQHSLKPTLVSVSETVAAVLELMEPLQSFSVLLERSQGQSGAHAFGRGAPPPLTPTSFLAES